MTPADVRLALLAKGYDPIPLSGKRPPMQAWSKVVPDEQLIRLWSAHNGYPGATNTGVLACRTPCLDLDVLDPQCADAMEAYIREKYEERGYVISRIGRWPKRAIPFRTDAPFSKITLALGRGEEKIEFLANGQQFVAFGIHPDTHEAYQWPRGSILEIAHEDLPYITHAEAQQDVAELGKISRDYSYNPILHTKSDGDGDGTWVRVDIEELTRRILSGESLHDSVLKIAGSYAGRGAPMMDAIDYIGLAFTAAHQPRYGGRWDECCAAISYCYDKERVKNAENAKSAKSAELPWVTPENWFETPPDPPGWTVKDLIPRRRVTLFSGHGAAGKSTVALHLAAAHVIGRPWLNFFPEFGPAFFIDAEDEAGIICQRLSQIADFYECTLADFANLHILSLADKDALLATANKGVIAPTALFLAIEERARAVRPQQIVIASSANVFAGNEIDRSQVTQFIQLLNRLAAACDGSVILISHPSLTGMASDSGLSGSTGWHNAVRSQMYLKGTNGENGEDTDLRKLEFKKNQYGKPAASLTLQWRNGMFLPLPGVTDFERAARDGVIEKTITALMHKFAARHQPISPNPFSRTYLPTVFCKEDEAKGITKADLAAAMDRMLNKGLLVIREWGPPAKRHPYVELP